MTWGRWYWPIWMLIVLVSFLGPEIYALVTNWRNTLSDWVWNATGAQRGLPITAWTAAHFLIGAILLVFMIWLFCHLVFHIWT